MNGKVYFTLMLVFALMACNNQKNQRPELHLHELGAENSKTVQIGNDLHIDIEVLAINRIDWLRVEIHAEESDKSLALNNNSTWSFDSIYSEFSGLKNVEFHKHISIPDSAMPGQYHFQFSVSDSEGNFSDVEDEITVLK
ncbi:MAG TPA: DUF4625 domain-containing protein [Prolixibacteraceae bacterium]|nr:DUF4625 domain-containing protein [Prolixibacteraceae bacterium]